MRILLVSLALLLSTTSLIAQEFSPAIKLQYYAGGCNYLQVVNLLKKDSSFDIYGSGTGTSPIATAISRFHTHIAKNNLAGCEECLLTIEAVMKDPRYKWKYASSGRTDLMIGIMIGSTLSSGSEGASRYMILLETMIDILNTKPQFDINYNVPTQDKATPTNAIAAVAQSGTKDALCLLLKKYPPLRYGLDNRISIDYFTPLMIAIKAGYSSMVTIFCNNGADYFLPVTGYGNFPPYELATQTGGDPLGIGKYLEDRRLGQKPIRQRVDNCVID